MTGYINNGFSDRRNNAQNDPCSINQSLLLLLLCVLVVVRWDQEGIKREVPP